MADGLDVIIVDDDPSVCKVVADTVKSFYTWGEVRHFNDADEAILYCLSSPIGVGIFIVDVFLGGKSGFFFLDAVERKFPSAHKDAIVVTGNASEDVVNMCMASQCQLSPGKNRSGSLRSNSPCGPLPKNTSHLPSF